MVRLVSVALIALSLPVSAWAKPHTTDQKPDQISAVYLPRAPAQLGHARVERIGRAELAPNLHFGFGMFGLKSEKSPMRPATVREIDAPKQRRAAVGFSLKF